MSRVARSGTSLRRRRAGAPRTSRTRSSSAASTPTRVGRLRQVLVQRRAARRGSAARRARGGARASRGSCPRRRWGCRPCRRRPTSRSARRGAVDGGMRSPKARSRARARAPRGRRARRGRARRTGRRAACSTSSATRRAPGQLLLGLPRGRDSSSATRSSSRSRRDGLARLAPGSARRARARCAGPSCSSVRRTASVGWAVNTGSTTQAGDSARADLGRRVPGAAQLAQPRRAGCPAARRPSRR